MILKNGLVFTENAEFVPADVELAGGTIVKVAPPPARWRGKRCWTSRANM